MTYFPLPSKPSKPELGLFPHFVGKIMHSPSRAHTEFALPYQNPRRVDLGGFEPPSEQHRLGHAKIHFLTLLTFHRI